ncbi:hypothetical protein JB92DRAFT_3108259 [Gautieria morchelliformis]|nr:hypothetical protein JB92DRAFT_3108259 [Gautieria morchelliformis]
MPLQPAVFTPPRRDTETIDEIPQGLGLISVRNPPAAPENSRSSRAAPIDIRHFKFDLPKPLVPDLLHTGLSPEEAQKLSRDYMLFAEQLQSTLETMFRIEAGPLATRPRGLGLTPPEDLVEECYALFLSGYKAMLDSWAEEAMTLAKARAAELEARQKSSST